MMKNATSGTGHFHAVKFYESPEALCEIVAEFLGEGLVGHHPALVIATPEHRAGILAALCTRRLDVNRLQSDGDLLLLDASDVLASFMVDGMPGLAARFGSPPTANAESIEVVKGPASALYGQQQPGGFVNIITKKPRAVSAATRADHERVGRQNVFRSALAVRKRGACARSNP